MAQNNELNANLTRVGLAALAGGATSTIPGPWFKRGSRLKMMALLSMANIAADNTNYLTIQLTDLVGNVLATIDTRVANQGAATAYVPLQAQVADIDLDLVIGLATKIVLTSAGTAAIAVSSVLQIDYHNR